MFFVVVGKFVILFVLDLKSISVHSRRLADTSPKKRGAPLGNQNAFRHGGYARYLPPESISYTTATRSRITFEEEIAYLRAYFRTTALAGTTQDDPVQPAFILRSLNVAAVAISRLVQSEVTLATLYGDCLMTDRLPEVTQVILKNRAAAEPAPQPSVRLRVRCQPTPGGCARFETPAELFLALFQRNKSLAAANWFASPRMACSSLVRPG